MTKPIDKSKLSIKGATRKSKRYYKCRIKGGAAGRLVGRTRDTPLYKSSANKILVFDSDGKTGGIVFKRLPDEQPIFTERMIKNVFGD